MKLEKIHKRKDFLNIQQNGNKVLMENFILYGLMYDKSYDSRLPRIGFTASKKIGNAVKRNKAKRRMRVLTQKFLKPLAKKNTDYVIIAKNKLNTSLWADLEKEMLQSIKSLHKIINLNGEKKFEK